MDFGYGIGGVIVLILDILGAHKHTAKRRIQCRKAALDFANHPVAADWLHHLAASWAGWTACEALTLLPAG